MFLFLCMFLSDSFGIRVRQKKSKRTFLKEFTRKREVEFKERTKRFSRVANTGYSFMWGAKEVCIEEGGGVNTIDASLAATHTWAHLRPQCDTSAPRGCLATPQTSRPKLPVLWEQTYLLGRRILKDCKAVKRPISVDTRSQPRQLSRLQLPSMRNIV